MSNDPNFDDRLFLAQQAVYEQMLRTNAQGGSTDVTAELMKVHLNESTREEG